MPHLSSRRDSGFTLIEAMVVTAILSVITMGVVTYMSTVNDIVSGETLQGVLEVNSSRVANEIAERVADGLIWTPTTIPFNTTLIGIENPVDLDGDGTVLDAAGNVEFGVRIPGGAGAAYPARMYYYLSLYPSGDPRYRVYESNVGDINGDGDTYDYFYRGVIRRYIYIPSPNYLYNNAPIVTDVLWGDCDGDGQWDYPFSMSADNVLTVKIFVFGMDAKARPMVIKSETQTVVRGQWGTPSAP